MQQTLDQKLDMSLDDIASAAKAASGKAPNMKRSNRRAESSPYADGRKKPESAVQSRRVYVGNLSWSVNWQDLKDHMRVAGVVEHADIMESNGRSKGCGLVTFSTPEEAQEAIKTLNDTELDGRVIFVREDREEVPVAAAPFVQDNVAPTQGNASSRVYVGNLPFNTKWQDLKDFMKPIGNVLHADIMTDGSGRSKGCGLVEFSSPEEAQAAIEQLNDTELNGRMVFVREDRDPESGSISSIAHRQGGGGRGGRGGFRSTPNNGAAAGGGGGDGRQLFVGNLPFDTTWQELKDLFREVGDVDRTDMNKRGFGIVRFVNPEAAAAAIDTFNNTEFKGRIMEVRFDKKD